VKTILERGAELDNCIEIMIVHTKQFRFDTDEWAFGDINKVQILYMNLSCHGSHWTLDKLHNPIDNRLSSPFTSNGFAAKVV